MNQSHRDLPQCWPALPLSSWNDTRATLHMWTQMVGKVRLALTPKVNHWWNVPLYISSRGLTTSPMPYGDRAFELRFDFLEHQLVLQSSDGLRKTLPLAPRSVADFYQLFMDMLRSAGFAVKIWKMPVEIPDPIPFDQDRVHASYDPESARKFWRILLSVQQVQPGAFLLGKFRSGGDALLRPPRAGAPRRRRHHARSLFPRSQQRGLLARQRRFGRRILLLRGSRASGLQE